MILVSSCLLGKPCRFDGKDNRNEKVLQFLAGKEYVEICPESMGGLTIPRLPAEIQGDKVVNKEGVDVTAYFFRGAEEALALAKKHGATLCILKESSPSCGVNKIHSGNFDDVKIKGMGVTARLLQENGFKVVSEGYFK